MNRPLKTWLLCAAASTALGLAAAQEEPASEAVEAYANEGAAAFATEAEAAAARGEYPNADAYLAFLQRDRNPVRLNQTGYLPGLPMIAVLEGDGKRRIPFEVLNADGSVAATGRTRRRAGVHIADMGDLPPADGYTLRVEEVGQSHPFDVRADLYAGLASDAFSYFYHNRAGVPIEARFVGDGYARPAGHTDERVTCFAGADMNGVVWPACDYELDVTGGWYDAGDHGKYVVNSGISVWTLLNLAELGLPAFGDASAIPERGNGRDDLLDEAKVNLDFMLAMQAPEGAQAAVIRGDQSSDLTKAQPEILDVSGMVHHKVADRRWTPLPTAPHETTEDRLLYPPSTAATLNLAAVAAQGARLFGEEDATYAEQLLAAARKAFAAAERLPDVYAYGNFDGSGGYGSTDVRRDKYWAAAEIYAATGEEQDKAAMISAAAALPDEPVSPDRNPSWGDTQLLGTISLALAAQDKDVAADAKASLISTAKGYYRQFEEAPYRIPKHEQDWGWGSNSDLMNRAMVLALAYELTDDRRYLNAVSGSMDYVLGRNPIAFSYVSGYGEEAAEHPHHRFWANQPADGYPMVPPGVLMGGPQHTGRYGPVSQVALDHCEGQTCYVDHIDSYEFNEVTINWNAPLVWVASYLDQVAAKP